MDVSSPELQQIFNLLHSQVLRAEDFDRVIRVATDLKHRQLMAESTEEKQITLELRNMWHERSRVVLQSKGLIPCTLSLEDEDCMGEDEWEALRMALETVFPMLPNLWRKTGAGEYVCRLQTDWRMSERELCSINLEEHEECIYDVAYDECELFYDYLRQCMK